VNSVLLFSKKRDQHGNKRLSQKQTNSCTHITCYRDNDHIKLKYIVYLYPHKDNTCEVTVVTKALMSSTESFC